MNVIGVGKGWEMLATPTLSHHPLHIGLVVLSDEGSVVTNMHPSDWSAGDGLIRPALGTEPAQCGSAGFYVIARPDVIAAHKRCLIKTFMLDWADGN